MFKPLNENMREQFLTFRDRFRKETKFLRCAEMSCMEFDQVLSNERDVYVYKPFGRIEGIVLYWKLDSRVLIGYGLTEQFQGQGIGKQMLQFMHDKAKQDGSRELIAGVEKENWKSILLLASFGFRVTEDKEDSLKMAYKI